MTEAPKCSQCGGGLPIGALRGLCPKCLGRVVFGIIAAEAQGMAAAESEGLGLVPPERSAGDEPKQAAN